MLFVTDCIKFIQLILTNEALERFGDFEARQVIRAVKYANDLVLLSNEETVLQGMTEGVIEVVICYGIEMGVERN